MRSTTLALLVSVTASTALAETLKIGDLAQGSEFTKCIKQTDYESKGLADDVEVVDRVDGCCPEGFTPGTKHTSTYYGTMVVCGFQDDGSIKMSTGSSNGVKTCTYNKCFVIKSDITCADADNKKMTLNGCCGGADASNKAMWPGDTAKGNKCANYVSSSSSNGVSTTYCTHYNSKYEKLGTSKKDDDLVVADGKTSLNLETLHMFTPCAGALGGAATTDTDGKSDADADPAVRAVVGMGAVLGAFMMA